MRPRPPSGPKRSAAVAAFVLAGAVIAAQPGVPPRAPDRDAIDHVLGRLGFGARPDDIVRVRSIGIPAYIDEQLRPEALDDGGLEAQLAGFPTLAMTSADLAAAYFMPALQARRQPPPPEADVPRDRPQVAMPVRSAQRVLAELMQAKVLRAAQSNRQLQEVLTDFWFNHFNVFAGKGVVRQYLTEYERDAIRPHVLGRFRTLLGAVAHSPAMLSYLDNAQSAAPNSRRRLPQNTPRGLNENYARELMELHTLGVDGGYTQEDVTELARILTGWTIDRPRLGGGFVFRPALHDSGTKRLLGRRFQPEGAREGERALDLLAAHPATARHLAYELAQRFVADEPPRSLVDRVASVYLESGGDLRAVTRAVLTSPEFLSSYARRAKIKTPFEFVVSAVRMTGASIGSAQPLVNAVAVLGMPLYRSQPPTGYPDTADAWVNTGALLGRMNVALQLVSNGRGGPDPIRPVNIDVASLAADTSAASQQAVVDRLLGGTASDATRRTLARAETPAQLVALALGSPEFQRH